MNVLLVSQCNKNALVETRRIIDQFAERCGTRTWQTHITQKGLETLKMLLKKTARRNTAVACHWIRGRDHTELMWIVGNASLFNEKGAVPTNATEQNILRQQDENDWHTLQDIKILSAIAALFHDFGKANKAFQKKLNTKSNKPIADAYRHEWVSLRLFQAFVGESVDDQNWLSRLAKLDQDFKAIEEKKCLAALIKDGITSPPSSPFENLPLIARAVGWLILTHHFLPRPEKPDNMRLKIHKNLLEKLGADWDNARNDLSEKDKQACWQFEEKLKLPFSSKSWRASASYWGEQALKRMQLYKNNWINDLYSLHLARLSLMLADHYYSSLPAQSNLGDPEFPIFANTDKEKNLKQRLDEHLIGVAKYSHRIVKMLPLLENYLPRIARHKGFKQRTANLLFNWQNQAYDLVCSLRERTLNQGFFGINMASTGCGKTLANGRIMYGLANPNRGARFSIALGLRTLTLQTGEAYRERLNLDDSDLAILVGSAAVKDLHDLGVEQKKLKQKKEEQNLKSYGSESAESLTIDNTYVSYEGSYDIGPLGKWIGNSTEAKKLLSAPILVCTIDHLIGATEATKGGKQITPMLRLLTSDLVLDEPDDFDIADLPALSRLIHWAGMLGSRVLLSSATLPPALVEGLFNAYKSGREMFQKSRGIPGTTTNICCAWFDEYHVVTSDHVEASSFMGAHQQFIQKRVKKLKEAGIRRQAVIKPLDINSQEANLIRQQVADSIHNMLHELHQQHREFDSETGKFVSFGLIRIANIDPLIDIAKYLFEKGAQNNHHIKLCCYHSRHPLLVRANIEKQLDNFLDRRTSIFKNQELRKSLVSCPEENLIFVVLASPVAEVGRDHDYDWAIVEPSSMRSIIQLAGRVRRHRPNDYTIPNIYLLNTNIRSLEHRNGTPAYCRPGFEKKGKDERFLLHSHKLNELLLPGEYEKINAEPRICARKNLMPKQSLADLEHARLQELMLGELHAESIPANLWWTENNITLSGAMQQATRFRNSHNQTRFILLFDEYEKKPEFYSLIDDVPKKENCLFSLMNLAIREGSRIEAWGNYDYCNAVSDLAEQLNMELEACAKRFGWIDIDMQREQNEKNWWYNPILGLRRKD